MVKTKTDSDDWASRKLKHIFDKSHEYRRDRYNIQLQQSTQPAHDFAGKSFSKQFCRLEKAQSTLQKSAVACFGDEWNQHKGKTHGPTGETCYLAAHATYKCEREAEERNVTWRDNWRHRLTRTTSIDKKVQRELNRWKLENDEMKW